MGIYGRVHVAPILHRSSAEARVGERARKETTVRRASASITLLLALLATAPGAQAGGLDLRIGAFLPRQHDCGIPSGVPAEYTLFQDVCDLYAKAGDGSIFNAGNPPFGGSVFGGIEYNHVVLKNVELAVHFDGYSEDHRHLLSRLRAAAEPRRQRHLPDDPAAGPAARHLACASCRPARSQDRALRRRGRRRGLLQVRGVRRLHRLLRPGPGDHARSLHRRRHRVRACTRWAGSAST